jgi:putative ABC transport system permease protein
MMSNSPDYPLNYFFIDDKINAHYENEHRLTKILMSVSFLAIFVACLGLFGLATFSAECRTKEFGIRKTFGATVPEIGTLLSRQFLKWIVIANVLAWPASYYIMENWLQNFAYRIEFGWEAFVLAGIISLSIALISVSGQAIKAATANPVDSLRYE